MRWVVIGVVLGIAMAANAAAAEETQSTAKCQVAEINPVTGHVFCIRPQGAPVAPPPSDIAPPVSYTHLTLPTILLV